MPRSGKKWWSSRDSSFGSAAKTEATSDANSIIIVEFLGLGEVKAAIPRNRSVAMKIAGAMI
jgi:hypothetical protein